jgi:hypothetical protein
VVEHKAVDVISVCSAEGEILPLRLQMIDEVGQLLRIHIQQAQLMERIDHVGVEAVVFQCRAKVYERDIRFRLKYTYRSHRWHLL